MFKPRKIWRPESPAQNEVFFSISGNPSTYEEISERIGKQVNNVRDVTYRLKKRGIADIVNLGLRRSSRTYSFSSYDLVGKLAGKTIVYVVGEGALLGKRIIRNMPVELNPQMKKSITHRLIPKLPEDGAEVVRDYMCYYVVCRYPFDNKEYGVRRAIPREEFAHENFPESKYATDFILPLETPVLVAHEGTVVLAKYDSDVNLSPLETKSLSKKEKVELAAKHVNLVGICHKDGFFTEYAHLAKKEVVSKGEGVNKGDTIGYVGMSGLTDLTHLHFNAFVIENEKGRSIPVKFVK